MDFGHLAKCERVQPVGFRQVASFKLLDKLHKGVGKDKAVA